MLQVGRVVLFMLALVVMMQQGIYIGTRGAGVENVAVNRCLATMLVAGSLPSQAVFRLGNTVFG